MTPKNPFEINWPLGCQFMHCQSDPNLFAFCLLPACSLLSVLVSLKFFGSIVNHCESFFIAGFFLRFFLRFSSLLIFTSRDTFQTFKRKSRLNIGFRNMTKNGVESPCVNCESFFKKQDFSWDFLGAFSSLLVFSSRDTFHNVFLLKSRGWEATPSAILCVKICSESLYQLDESFIRTLKYFHTFDFFYKGTIHKWRQQFFRILDTPLPHVGSFLVLKSEVAIASLLCQTKQAKKKLLEVKTITKSLGNGIAESVKSCNLHKKGRILWF